MRLLPRPLLVKYKDLFYYKLDLYSTGYVLRIYGYTHENEYAVRI